MRCSSRWFSGAVASALIIPGFARAQEAPPAYSYATYFECNPAGEQRADALMRQTFFPIQDRYVADKRLVGWGWLAHNLGGHWRRAGFMVGSSLDAVLDGQSAVLKEMQARRKEFAELGAICPRHEDYIWRQVTSSPARGPDAPRSVSRLGTYFECDVAREARADTLVMQAFAPIWDRHTVPDRINYWGWHEHIIGGKYRRLLLLDGGSHKAILATLDTVLADIARERPAEGREFSQICHSHQDYLWDVQTPRR